MQTLTFLVDKEDVDELVLYTCGYYRVHTGSALHCTNDFVDPDDEDDVPPGRRFMRSLCAHGCAVPPYAGMHSVQVAGWNYADTGAQQQRLVDLARPANDRVPISEEDSVRVLVDSRTDDEFVRCE